MSKRKQVETARGTEHVTVTGPLGPGQRWSVERKREVVLRLLRGEPMEALSRELAIEVYRLEQWKENALFALSAGLRERPADPLRRELDQALKRIGELTMENELLRVRCQQAPPFPRLRSKR